MSNELEKALVNAFEQTKRQPALALIHAVELDRKLKRIGFEEPITYALHGNASPNRNSDQDGAPWRTFAPRRFDCLYQAHRQFGDLCGFALANAFNNARGPEIPALNLLYANECLEIENLWLRFFNKYLSYNGVKSKMLLKKGSASRFERLCSLDATYPNAHTGGPLVSVLMPIYNASATLRKAAQSILEQTWQNLELILIDDCSQDNSLQIAYGLRMQDPRVRVIALNTNGGPYIAKNVALSVAKGQYLTVHDADDWAFPTRIEYQLQPLLKPKVSGLAVTMGRTLRCDINGQFTRFQPLDWVSLDGALRLCFPSPLFDRAYFDQKLGAWDSVRVGADLEIFQRIYKFDLGVLRILDTPVMLQLDLEESLTRNKETHNDERGESPVRMAYRKSWESWHSLHTEVPKYF